MWDIVSFEMLHNGMPFTVAELNENHDLSFYLFRVAHTGAYLINREAAKKYLSKSYPIKMPIDHFFTRSWEFDIKFRGIEPRIIFQRGEDSVIESSKISKDSKREIYSYISRVRLSH
jgi:GR25 family glycosyltransferase involved in LPS biosynthesis